MGIEHQHGASSFRPREAVTSRCHVSQRKVAKGVEAVLRCTTDGSRSDDRTRAHAEHAVFATVNGESSQLQGAGARHGDGRRIQGTVEVLNQESATGDVLAAVIDADWLSTCDEGKDEQEENDGKGESLLDGAMVAGHEDASAFHGASQLRLRDDRRAALCMSRGDLPGGRTVEYATVPGPDNAQSSATGNAAPSLHLSGPVTAR